MIMVSKISMVPHPVVSMKKNRKGKLGVHGFLIDQKRLRMIWWRECVLIWSKFHAQNFSAIYSAVAQAKAKHISKACDMRRFYC